MSIKLDTGFSSRQIYLDSEYATVQVGGSTSDCIWVFKDYISAMPNISMMMSVVDVEIPLAFYVVNENNNTIVWESSTGSTHTYTITEGNYSTDDLLTQLDTTVPMKTAGNWTPTYTPTSDLTNMAITYDDLTNKITFDCTGGTQSPDNITATSTALEILGFKKETAVSFTADKLTSQSNVNLAGITAIYVDSNFQTDSLDSKSGATSSILCKIPVNVSSLGILVWTNYTGYKTYIKEKHLNVVRLRLLDTDRNVLDLNGVDWTATLQVDFVYTREYSRDSKKKIAKTLNETERKTAQPKKEEPEKLPLENKVMPNVIDLEALDEKK